ncbi:glycosyltransferase family 2 protein [Thiohalophilus sp.]|uniref:glycosyltransferase family 2 protein n=1 Tax=Thiohalophilus sp. TaxID=3028392 RepID=UPI002ACE1837|nr:glycosyltransferase family 2 protein [Thiohalophilus sp.]MDZ7803482.1 glycosyltransferase family 2 protein [Thiohalophilus sp.]
MKISVIIPAYNVEKFIAKAIASASELSEVGEIIIVDDGSSDKTLEISRGFQLKNEKVRVFEQPGGKNRGVSAARNEGIKNSKFNYIAFLDADDFYLPNRFDQERKIFRTMREVHGVYGAIGTSYITDKGKKKFQEAKFKEITSVSDSVNANELLYVLLGASKLARGHIHLNGLTVRREVFDMVGLFDTELRLSQDTDLLLRLAVKCRLVPGSIKQPVAVRGIHDSNRVTNSKNLDKNRMLLWKKVYQWGVSNGMPEDAIELCRKKMLMWKTHHERFIPSIVFLVRMKKESP